eukprot:7491227-Pyramimonas_sp.AAC.1
MPLSRPGNQRLHSESVSVWPPAAVTDLSRGHTCTIDEAAPAKYESSAMPVAARASPGVAGPLPASSGCASTRPRPSVRTCCARSPNARRGRARLPAPR